MVGPINSLDFSHTKVWWYRWYHLHHLIKSIWSSFKTSRYLAKLWLQKIKPDIVHLNTSTLVAWGKVAHNMGIPVVWHIREPLADGYLGLRKYFIKKCVEKYATLILPICKNDSIPWKNNFKTHIVYNAVDKKIFSRKNNLDYGFNKSGFSKILFLGGLSKVKGTLVILKAFEKLLMSGVDSELLIAGYFDKTLSKPYQLSYYLPTQIYKRKVMKILNRTKVVLLGAIKNVPAMMEASDVIVFPATEGHFARPVIEAGFMSKPVIASDFPPLNELIINGKTGFLIDPNNTNEWARKLETIIINSELRSELGINAYHYCKNRFDIDDQIKLVQDLYRNIFRQV